MNPGSDEPRVPPTPPQPTSNGPGLVLDFAKAYAAQGRLAASIDAYARYIEFLPSTNDMKLVDQVSLTKLSLTLAENSDGSRQSEEEVMKSFLSIINNFPQNAIVLNALAVFLYNTGEYNAAKGYLQKAVTAGYMPAEKNLLHVLWHLIPRWHYRMLNDQKRNEYYQNAINKAIHAGYKNVYDIGAGCGLLTLIAASTDVENVSVTAFEENKTLYTISNNLCNSHKLTNVKLFYKNSNEVVDPPGPCDLIVTEIFDAALFGENCLSSIRHAFGCFASRNCKIIPSGAKVYLTLFQANRLNKKVRYVNSLPELMIENICLTEIDQEMYDAEYLKNEEIMFLSETKPILTLDFFDVQRLEAMCQETYRKIPEANFVVNTDGELHGFAVWFDLHLDSEIYFSTSPFDNSVKCWEQAVYYIDHPITVKKGSQITVKPSLFHGQLNFTTSFTHNDDCFKVSQEIISFLNDEKLVQDIIGCVNAQENTNVKVVDSNNFPLFGLLMAKKGAVCSHVYREECDLEFFNYLVEINNIPSENFICIDPKAMENFSLYLEKPDILFTNFIKIDGSYSNVDTPIEIDDFGAIETIPRKIKLRAMLIFSNYLDICNRVDDSKTLGFQISQHMNEFSVINMIIYRVIILFDQLTITKMFNLNNVKHPVLLSDFYTFYILGQRTS